jgi:hypothetical protein
MTYLAHAESWPLAERCAARLDGELTNAFLAIDSVDDHHARAHKVVGRFDGRLVLTGISALWALGLTGEPGTHRVSQVGLRVKLPHSCNYILEQRAFRPGDLWGAVTSPLRTATDVLRAPAQFQHNVFRLLCQAYQLTDQQIRSRLRSMGTTPGLSLAYSRLDELRLEGS